MTSLSSHPSCRAPRAIWPSIVVWWAVTGVAVPLVEAVYRLGARTMAAIRSGLTATQWGLFALTVLLFAYAEGYRALQQRFAPRVVSRALALRHTDNVLWRILAPLYAMSLVGADRRHLARAWASVGLIVAAILVMREIPQPWRGMVDGGVAVALTWGLLALGTEWTGQSRSPKTAIMAPERATNDPRTA